MALLHSSQKSLPCWDPYLALPLLCCTCQFPYQLTGLLYIIYQPASAASRYLHADIPISIGLHRDQPIMIAPSVFAPRMTQVCIQQDSEMFTAIR